MNRIISAVKLDFLTAKSEQRIVIIAFLIPIVIGLASRNPYLTMVFAMMLSTNIAGTVFAIHEKSHSDKLYGILPLKKSEMIAGRYLFGIIIGVLAIVIAGILFLVISKIMKSAFTGPAFWGVFALAFIYYCFAVAISYPIYLKFTFAKAYIFTMLPVYVILIIIVVLARKTGLAGTMSHAIQFFSRNLFLVPITGIIAGLVLLVISAVIANLIYTRREI